MDTIKTNFHWRDFKYRDEVPAKVLAEQFNHLEEEEEDAIDVLDALEGCIFELSRTGDDPDTQFTKMLQAGSGFFKYRGRWYHVSDFLRLEKRDAMLIQKGWQGYHADSYVSIFSGVLLRVSNDGERYQVATYIT